MSVVETIKMPEHYSKIMELFLDKYEKLSPEAIRVVCDYMSYGLHPRFVISKDEKLI